MQPPAIPGWRAINIGGCWSCRRGGVGHCICASLTEDHVLCGRGKGPPMKATRFFTPGKMAAFCSEGDNKQVVPWHVFPSWGFWQLRGELIIKLGILELVFKTPYQGPAELDWKQAKSPFFPCLATENWLGYTVGAYWLLHVFLVQ